MLYKPWDDRTDTPVGNEKARKMFQSVITVSLPEPENKGYRDFLAKQKALYAPASTAQEEKWEVL